MPSHSVNVAPHEDHSKYIGQSYSDTNNRGGGGVSTRSSVGAPPPIMRMNPNPSLVVPVRDYHNLQDPPSPSGKLVDRIFRMRQKCIESFGRDIFDDAYRYLRAHADVS